MEQSQGHSPRHSISNTGSSLPGARDDAERSLLLTCRLEQRELVDRLLTAA